MFLCHWPGFCNQWWLARDKWQAKKKKKKKGKNPVFFGSFTWLVKRSVNAHAHAHTLAKK